MGKFIKDFDTTQEMKDYFKSAESGYSYLFRDKSKFGTAISKSIDGDTPIISAYKNKFDYFTVTAVDGDAEVELYGNWNVDSSRYWPCYYSADEGETWIEFGNSVNVQIPNGTSLKFRIELNEEGRSGQFISHVSGKYKFSGSVASISNNHNTDFAGVQPCKLRFSDCKNGLVDASELVIPYSEIINNGLQDAFDGCTLLQGAPKIMAKKVGDHACLSMFSNCRSLTTAPELPATELGDNCYEGMFERCSSLTTAPELPATKLGNYCYSGMFERCSSLTTAPSKLPATKLEYCCYSTMFRECVRLTKAPVLMATSFDSGCYFLMFYDCHSLNYIDIRATSWDTSCAFEWVNGVAYKGTFVDTMGANPPIGTNGVPNNWTILNS